MKEPAPILLLQEASLSALAQIRDDTEDLFLRYGSQPSDITITLKKLFWYLGARSQAVSLLVSFGYAWDAEIILRSIYETAAKILLLCFAEEDEKPVLVREFWNEFAPINDRRTARKAAFSQKMFAEDSVSASIFAMLQDNRVFDLETEVSKAERKRLEHKWSFSEIIENLDRRAAKGKPVKGIKTLLHMYGIASHLIHADKNAMDLMEDRARRDPLERKLLEGGHLTRIMSDQVSMFWYCADALRQHFKGDLINPDKFYNIFEVFSELTKPISQAFDDSQRDFYSKWRDKTT